MWIKRYTSFATMILALGFGVSLVSGGVGNVGRSTDIADGGGSVTLTQSGDFVVSTTAGQSMTTIRDSLVSLVDASPLYAAASVADPNDPGVASLAVTLQGGAEAAHIRLCTNDTGINHVGVSFTGGKRAAVFNTPRTVNGNGTYRVQIDIINGVDFDMTFSTTVAPNNSPIGLHNSVIAALHSSGFDHNTPSIGSGYDDFDCIITKPGDQVLAVRTTVTDTGAALSCVDLTDDPPWAASIPTLSQYGMFTLMLLMAGAAILMARRKAAANR